MVGAAPDAEASQPCLVSSKNLLRGTVCWCFSNRVKVPVTVGVLTSTTSTVDICNRKQELAIATVSYM